MRIAIDATAIPRLMAGAGVYTYQLVRALAALEADHDYVVFAHSDAFDELARQRPRLRVVHVRARSRAERLLWEQLLLPGQLRRLGIDVLHSPHHTTPALPLPCPRVVTLHDVTFFLLPQRYPPTRRLYFQAITRAAARLAQAIITPSDAVKRDVVRVLGVPQERITAIAEAPAPEFAPLEDADALGRIRWRYKLPSRYILSVGNLEPGKNRGRLIAAYGRLRERGLQHHLVIAGQRAWRYENDLALVRRLRLDDVVHFLGYVDGADMPGLYSGADLLAFPSLYEGFGLPVLEAMACGTPVVTSSVSALPEVAGDAALLVDPKDVVALTEAMERALADEALRADLRARGLKRAGEFSWDKAAQKTVRVYEAVAGR
ncbi:MAG: glycosyltransferase family 1 protein [Dehalococcoidia bacterium]